MSQTPFVPVEPSQCVAWIFRRRTVLHGHKFFNDAHWFRLDSLPGNATSALRDRMAIFCRVSTRCMVGELPLDVSQHAADAKAEEIRMEPRVAKFLLHKRQPFERLLRRPDAARRFEADRRPGLLRILANGARHHQANRKRGIDGFLAGGGFDEIGAGHHGDRACARHVAKGEQIPGAEDHLHGHGTAGSLEQRNLIVKLSPFPSEHVGSRDDHINLVRPGLNGAAYFSDALLKRRESGRESRRDSSDVNATALESAKRGLNEGVIHAHSRDFQIELFDSQTLHHLVLNRLPGLRAQSAHALVCIVAGQRGEVHARNRAQEPGYLPLFLYGAPTNQRLRPTFHGAPVYADLLDPIEVESDAPVWLQGTSGKGSDHIAGFGAGALRGARV